MKKKNQTLCAVSNFEGMDFGRIPFCGFGGIINHS
jgi:hypothetical protein